MGPNDTGTAKERVEITTLEDLGTYKIKVEIEHAGRILVIPLKTLTYFEWVELGYEVPNPVPPAFGVDKQGRPIPDLRNPDYLRQVDEAAMERNYVRLLASLDLPISGETTAEKIATLKKMLDFNVVRQLNSVLNDVVSEGEARIIGRAETFHRRGDGDSQSL